MFVLDSNVFITAMKTYYSFDFCPGFWEFLIQKSLSNEVCITKSVIDEIEAGKRDNDLLRKWIEYNKEYLSVIDDSAEDIQISLRQILTDIQTNVIPNNFSSENISNFANIADSWIIATALKRNMTLVTNEVLTNENSRKIKIPNICKHYEISCVKPFDMLRELKLKLIHQ